MFRQYANIVFRRISSTIQPNEDALRQQAIATLEALSNKYLTKQSTYVSPQRPLKHMEIKTKGPNYQLLDAFTDFCVTVGRALGAHVPGPRSLPIQIKKWSVLSSPFAHKTAWTQFERRTHTKLVSIYGLPDVELQKRFIWYIERHAPPDVSFECALHEYTTIKDFLKRNGAESDSTTQTSDNLQVNQRDDDASLNIEV